MSKLKKIAESLKPILEINSFTSIHNNFKICETRNKFSEDDCPESRVFFSELRKNMLIHKLLNHDDRLGLSGTGKFSFVLTLPPNVISSENKSTSLKILSGLKDVAKNEIRALTYTNERKNDYFIHLEGYLFQNIKDQSICYILLPNYDLNLLDLMNNSAFQDVIPSIPSTMNERTNGLTKINDDLIYILGKLFRAVQFMRDNQMAHRDIKLENILVQFDFATRKVKNIVLSDLGDTCIRDESSTKVCGTAVYSAPEIFYGATLDEKTTVFTMRMMQDIDVFAIGQCINLILSRKMIRMLAKKEVYINPQLQEINQRLLQNSEGMHMSDVYQLFSSSQSKDDLDPFTKTLFWWTHPNIRKRNVHPFDLQDRQLQEKNILSLIEILTQKSKDPNPVYHLTYRVHKVQIEEIRSRYKFWLKKMEESTEQ